MYKPWIKDLWGKPENALGGAKLMLVGESHYGSHVGDTGDEGLTVRVVQEHIDVARTKLFSKIENLLQHQVDGLNLELPGNRQAFWSSVLFCNYIPVSVGPDFTHRPTNEMWELGKDVFTTLLQEHKPDAVLVLAKGVWDWMPQSDVRPAPKFRLRGSDVEFRQFKYLNGEEICVVPAAYVNHPTGSRGWETSKWLEVPAHLFTQIRRGVRE
jgi:hypothetical protein